MSTDQKLCQQAKSYVNAGGDGAATGGGMYRDNLQARTVFSCAISWEARLQSVSCRFLDRPMIFKNWALSRQTTN